VAKVTSKRQVTIPKGIADRYGIASGDEIEFLPAGDAIRVQRSTDRPEPLDRDRRLERYDEATLRQQARQKDKRSQPRADRGWRREDLYERGRTR
jgi:AbrB family looped-hinge helix DNA binding protein